MFTHPHRTWHRNDPLSFLFILPRQPSALPYTWSLLMLNTLKEQGLNYDILVAKDVLYSLWLMFTGICLATLVMMPKQQTQHVSSLVAKQLCALREHATLKSLGVYSTSHQTTPTPVSHPESAANKTHDSTGHNHKSRTRPRSHRISSETTTLEPIEELSHPTTRTHRLRPVGSSSEPVLTSLHQPFVEHAATTATSPTAALDAQYFEVAEYNARKLVEAAEGGEMEGWVLVGITKDVKVMKKPAGKNELPINSVKGIGIVKTPPRFIIRVLNNPTYTTILDDMLKESRVLQELSKSLHLVHLLYKAVWPTAPREFSVLSILGELDDRTWISSGVSVDDPRIPAEKGYVRGHLDVGGYLIRSVPSNPELSEVTYVARVDLKGNIPAFAVNKISESQPLCVNRLRGLVEPLYIKMKSDPQKMREFEERYPIVMAVSPKSASTHKQQQPVNDVNRAVGSGVTKEIKEDIVIITEDVGAVSSTSGGETLTDEARPTADDGNKEKDIATHYGSRAAANGGETAKPGKSDSTESGEEESAVVISMSDLSPSEAIHIPPNTKLVPSSDEPRFSVGEGDGDSLPDSWNGEFLETYTPEQFPSDPEEEGEPVGAESVPGTQDVPSNVFVSKPSPGLQLKLPNYQRVRDSIAATEDVAEVRSMYMYQVAMMTS